MQVLKGKVTSMLGCILKILYSSSTMVLELGPRSDGTNMECKYNCQDIINRQYMFLLGWLCIYASRVNSSRSFKLIL
jgi:hypothetical protein